MSAREWMKIIMLAAFCAVAFAGHQRASALEKGDILFYAPFEGDTNAQIARGSKAPTSGTVEFAEGIRGQGVVIGGGDNLNYQTSGNFNKDSGTVSIWVKPVDWRRGDGKSHTFVTFPGEGKVHAYLLYNYYVGWTWFTLLRAGGNNRIIGEGLDLEPEWKPGEWHHLAATWQEGEMCLYLDGNLRARLTEDVPLMEKAGPQFQVGERSSKTVFDELMIFSRPLMPVEVKALYERDAAEKGKVSPRITISRTAKGPTIDGRLSPGEWNSAVAVSVLKDTFFGNPIEDQSTMFMTFDEKNLYLALRYAIPEEVRRSPDSFPGGPLKCEARQRDDKVWRDDCFEILLSPGEGSGQHLYRFVANAMGVLFDSKDGQRNWNSNALSKSRIDENEWVLEIAIPFSDLGVSVPPDGAKWLFNLAQQWRRLSDQKGVLFFSSKDLKAMGELVFASQSPVLQLSDVGSLDEGKVLVEGLVSNPGNSAIELTLRAHTPGKEINESTALRLEPGTSQSFLLRSAISEALASKLIIEGTDSTGKTFCMMRFPLVFGPRLLAKLHHFPSKEKLVVEIRRTGGGAEKREKSFFAEVNLRDHNSGESLKHLRSEPFTKAKKEVTLDISDIPPGLYDVVASLRTSERKLGEKVVQFEKKKLPEWLNNRIGITEKVPPPWPPLQVQRDGKMIKVSCWGRQYQFGGGLFPSQVITQGKPLLSSPMRLKIGTNGRERAVEQREVKVAEARENRVELESKGIIEGADITVKTNIEYDGFAWFDLTIKPKAEMTIGSLAFEMPYTSKYATLFYSTDFDNVGLIKPDGYQGPYPNFFWVGCGDGGIEWVSEAPAGWKIVNPSQTLQVIRDAKQGKEVIVRLNIIDGPKKIDKPLKISFGIQATPVRPKPKGWRKWRVCGSEEPEKEYPGVEGKPWLLLYQPEWSVHLNYPVIKPEWKETLKRREAKGIRSCLYAQIIKTSPRTPEYKYFYEEWRMIPSAEVDFDRIDEIKITFATPTTWWLSASACPKSSFSDFYMWHLARSVKEADIKGLYFDISGPEPCANQEHGCGWVDEEGQVQPTLPIRAEREFLKRVYVVLKENDPTSIVAIHMSCRNLMPMDAFSEIMVDGEQFNWGIQKQIAATGKSNYYDLLPLDKMRAEFMSYNWGPLTAFLPAFVPYDGSDVRYLEDAPETIASIEHLVGLFLLHDSQMWPAWMNTKPLYDVWLAQEKFGWDDEVEFIPYWDKRASEYVSLETGGVQPVVCSIFKRPDKVMLVLFNNSDEDAEVTIRLNADKMGLAHSDFSSITDFYTGGTWFSGGTFAAQVKGSSWKVPLRKRNFRMLVPQ